jgi:hypothetical protein
MDIKSQLRNAAPILVMVYALTTAILSFVIFLGIEHHIELDHFTQDPASIMNTPFYLGFFSYMGILFWCAAAAICFFTRLLLPATVANHRIKLFLLYSGLVTSLLMFDDLFLLHEEVLPKYFFISKNVVYLIYVNIILIYLYLFRAELINSEFIFLVIAAGLIAVSQFVDSIPMPIPEDSFLEDAVKLFGIVTWFTYYGRYCLKKGQTLS